MSFDHPDGGGVNAARGQRCPVRGGLRGLRRCRDVDGVAILVRGGAAQHRQDAVAVGLGVRQPLEQQHHTTLTRHESICVDVERMAMPGLRQHSQRGPGCGLARVHLQRHAARERHVAFALVQAAARHVHRGQTG